MVRTIIIVGGGFCGTVLAANLLRRPGLTQTRVVLIERELFFGRGAAYAPREFPYLLNVTAARMAADSRKPLDFLHYAQQRIPEARATDFLPRALYGEYLTDLLFGAKQAAPANVSLEKIRATVVDVERREASSQLRVSLDNGVTLSANEVVIACGNPAPASLGALSAIEHSPRYCVDPWRAQHSFVDDEPVLLVGSGLTAADVILAATTGEHGQQRGPQLHVLSRHGLIPLPQSVQHGDPCAEHPDVTSPQTLCSVRATFRAFRRLAEDVSKTGGHWQQVVALIRNRAPQLWQQFSQCERGRFLRHVRAYWDAHRHRLPQQVHSHIQALRESGRLQTYAGRIVSAREVDAGICVTWRARGETHTRELTVSRVINCTGPDYTPHRSRDPLMRSLLERGCAVPDAFNLGLKTSAHGSLIDATGHASSRLFCLGPLLRADHWEATSVAELRGHAEGLAAHLTAQPAALKKIPAITALIPAAP